MLDKVMRLAGSAGWIVTLGLILLWLRSLSRPHLDCECAAEELDRVEHELAQFEALHSEFDQRAMRAQKLLGEAWAKFDAGHYRPCLRKAQQAVRELNRLSAEDASH
jgi:hypothetical protein